MPSNNSPVIPNPRKRPHSAISQETIYRPYTKPQDRIDEFPRKRIRDIERQLRLGTKQAKTGDNGGPQIKVSAKQGKKALAATRRAELERELRQRQKEEAIRIAEAKRLTTMRKYKKVKFMELQKSKRRYKAAQKALESAATQEDREKLRRLLHIAEVDKNYVQFTPLGWKYVGLYRDDDDERPHKGDPDMWNRVGKAMEEGTLDNLKHEMMVEVPQAERNKAKGDLEVVAGEDEDDEGGGDFFE